MDKYAEFLRARLNELERMATRVGAESYQALDLTMYVESDIAAKRKILDAVDQGADADIWDGGGKVADALADVVKALCEPFASHPSYPGERP